MKRNEIKESLSNMGASAKLLQMPAVMERIYNYCIDYDEETFIKKIRIGLSGEIMIKGDEKFYNSKDGVSQRFSLIENNEALFENFDTDGIELNGKYFIDEYGMDKIFKSYFEPLFEQECVVERVAKKTLKINYGAKFVEDEGDPILNYYNYTILKKNFSRTIGWEQNKYFLTKFYPITRKWFENQEIKK